VAVTDVGVRLRRAVASDVNVTVLGRGSEFVEGGAVCAKTCRESRLVAASELLELRVGRVREKRGDGSGLRAEHVPRVLPDVDPDPFR
jgi:hypothetical protein